MFDTPSKGMRIRTVLDAAVSPPEATLGDCLPLPSVPAIPDNGSMNDNVDPPPPRHSSRIRHPLINIIQDQITD